LKYLKLYEDINELDPFDEEDWDETETIHNFENPDPNFDGNGNLILVQYGDPRYTIMTYVLIQTIYKDGKIVLYKDINFDPDYNFYPVPEKEFEVMKKIGYPKINVYNSGKWVDVPYNYLLPEVRKRIVLK